MRDATKLVVCAILATVRLVVSIRSMLRGIAETGDRVGPVRLIGKHGLMKLYSKLILANANNKKVTTNSRADG